MSHGQQECVLHNVKELNDSHIIKKVCKVSNRL
jgi:hypothetical protein